MLGKLLFCRGGFMRHHGRHHGFGPFGGPWMGPEWGDETRARRGDIKYQILEVLAEKPRHGYDIIKDIEQRRGGFRPSAGSVYPTLQMLEDGGFVTSEQVDGKKVYTITNEGRVMLDNREPQEDDDEPRGPREQVRHLKESAMKLAHAVMQAARTGHPDIRKRTKQILDKARREVYALLAEDEA
jgi:DNA-binding PadR family transcriptional regulator